MQIFAEKFIKLYKRKDKLKEEALKKEETRNILEKFEIDSKDDEEKRK